MKCSELRTEIERRPTGERQAIGKRERERGEEREIEAMRGGRKRGFERERL